jgi:hypothetical protein
MVSKVPVIKLPFLKNLPIHITSPSLKEGVFLVLRVGCESFLRTEYRDLFVSYFQIWLWMKWCQFSSGRVEGVLTPSSRLRVEMFGMVKVQPRLSDVSSDSHYKE